MGAGVGYFLGFAVKCGMFSWFSCEGWDVSCKMFSLFCGEGWGAGVGCLPGLAVKGGSRCRIFSLFCSEVWDVCLA